MNVKYYLRRKQVKIELTIKKINSAHLKIYIKFKPEILNFEKNKVVEKQKDSNK